MNESRIIRIARGSGRLVKDVMDMLKEYKRIAKMWSKLRLHNKNVRDHQIIKALPPNLLKQMGGEAGVMKQMSSKGGPLI
jgi:signal recognition particle subunit SRP54